MARASGARRGGEPHVAYLGEARHSPGGFLRTTLVGESNNELTYLFGVGRRWRSAKRKWTAFMADTEWLAVRSESEKDGPIVATLSNQILALDGILVSVK